jgi:hypothetical protein
MLLRILGGVEPIAVAVVKRNSGSVFKNPSLLFKLLLAGASFASSSFNAVLWAAWSRKGAAGRRSRCSWTSVLADSSAASFSVRLVDVFTLTGLCRLWS